MSAPGIAMSLIVAAGLAAATVTPASAETPDPRGGTVRIVVSGVPDEPTTGRVRIRLAGPAGSDQFRSHRVTPTIAVKNLKPGDYVVEAKRVKTGDGPNLQPRIPTRWITVRSDRTRKVRFAYKPVAPIPGFETQIRSDQLREVVCRDLYDDPTVTGMWAKYDDPMSWFCHRDMQYVGRMDLSRWCNVKYRWSHAELKGNRVWDWYCVA